MTEREFQEEINKRIDLINSNHESIRRMQKKDYLQVIIFCGICLVGLLIGAFL